MLRYATTRNPKSKDVAKELKDATKDAINKTINVAKDAAEEPEIMGTCAAQMTNSFAHEPGATPIRSFLSLSGCVTSWYAMLWHAVLSRVMQLRRTLHYVMLRHATLCESTRRDALLYEDVLCA